MLCITLYYNLISIFKRKYHYFQPVILLVEDYIINLKGNIMKVKTLFLMTLCASPLAAVASDGDISFQGKIVSAACTLKGFNSGTTTTGYSMDLPSVTPSSFSGAAGYAGMTDFTIDLQNCDTTTLKNAQVAFSGTVDSLDTNILNNLSTATPATGVGVALLEDDGTAEIGINGGTPSKPQVLTTGDTSLHYKVAYKANTSTPAVTAGNVTAKAFIDITYR